MRASLICLVLATAATATAGAPRAAAPRDFLAEAKVLLVVGACAPGTIPPEIPRELVAEHCKVLAQAQDAYKTGWMAEAEAFFARAVPATVPKVVVYPFAGGDLATALAVFPDADEITTLSLEPAGDPLDLGRLDAKQLKAALATVDEELGSLYRENFSITMNMIGAMRRGRLPTQLIFSLSALWLHGDDVTSLRYFKLTRSGKLVYLTDKDVAAAEAIRDPGARNRRFANVEFRFHRHGSTHEQIYRHILANLDDAHLEQDPAALAYLEKRGHVAAITKAASYLLTFENFATMRRYLIRHVDWMVSDTTGLAPTYGTPAGFAYETYGQFVTANMAAGKRISPVWKKLFAEQPTRPLAFRFGYPDGDGHAQLVIMTRVQ